MSEQELREQLQAAQAEAAVLREALTLAYGVSLPSRWKKWPKSEAKVKAALSGDAGAAYQREHAAMKRVVDHVRAWLAAREQVSRAVSNSSFTLTDIRRSTDRSAALEEQTYDLLAAYDALSAPAAEPEYQAARGVLPMQPGDERPEDTIRRLRDTGYGPAELPTDVRPDVLETGRRIIDEDRELLDRLAAYDAEPSKGAEK